jgi:hypothetical protein
MKRILVALSFAAFAAPVFAAEISAPYEQVQVDRAVPSIQSGSNGASTGSTKTEANPWANDWNFIAPAQ